MIKLIYATTNAAKLASMKKMTEGLDIEIVGLDAEFPPVGESGSSPLENAKIKAEAYYAALKRPLFSCDSGLYIDGLREELQPGAHIRTRNGKYMNDGETIEYYAGLARSLGGRMTARYANAICLILADDEIFTHTGDDISYEKFIITDRPHAKITPGFPLDSLSVHIPTRKYYYDMDARDELSLKTEDGFRNFFKKVLRIT